MKKIILLFVLTLSFNSTGLGLQEVIDEESGKEIELYSSCRVREGILSLHFFLKNNSNENIFVFNDDYIFYNLLDTTKDFNSINYHN